MKNRQLRGLTGLVWAINLAITLGLTAFLLTTNPATGGASHGPFSPGPSPEATTNRPRRTPIPPPTQRATITPFPSPTPGPSLTPLPQPPANRQIIGYSVEGRLLEVYRFGSGKQGKLIVAGIHGGYEGNTTELAWKLINYLSNQQRAIPADVTLYILPSLNPDGFARARGIDGRVNANGVDLNRNWPYNWQADWDRAGCWTYRPVTGGESPASEPETRALIAFIEKIEPQTLISYHSAALGIFAGGVPNFDPSLRLAETLAAVTNYPYPPIDTGCHYTGNLTDWAANVRNIAAVDIELTNHRDTDFEQNLRVLQVFLNWSP